MFYTKPEIYLKINTFYSCKLSFSQFRVIFRVIKLFQV